MIGRLFDLKFVISLYNKYKNPCQGFPTLSLWATMLPPHAQTTAYTLVCAIESSCVMEEEFLIRPHRGYASAEASFHEVVSKFVIKVSIESSSRVEKACLSSHYAICSFLYAFPEC
jgi:hypothetical protein